MAWVLGAALVVATLVSWKQLEHRTDAQAAIVEASPSAGNRTRGGVQRAPDRQSATAASGIDPGSSAKLDLPIGRWSGATGARDAFAVRHWTAADPPQPPAAPAASAAPLQASEATAPPLPFVYLGMLEEAPGRVVWYLGHGERLVVAAVGDVIDAVYRVEGVRAGRLQLLYLPMNQSQSLAIGDTP